MKLLHSDVIAVHEKVQQVDGQVSGWGAELQMVADDSDEVSKVSPEVELRGLTFEGRQLEFLLDKTSTFECLPETINHRGFNMFLKTELYPIKDKHRAAWRKALEPVGVLTHFVSQCLVNVCSELSSPPLVLQLHLTQRECGDLEARTWTRSSRKPRAFELHA